jgi:hypothetical protein
MKRAAAALGVLAAAAFAREAGAQCAGRPTDANGAAGYSYAGATVLSYATSRAKVFYATSGPHAPVLTSTRSDNVPDTVAFAADVAEQSLAHYEQLGYRKPPSDAACASNGGDGKLDIYLVKFAGADGTTIKESCQGRSCASWVLVEATFAGRGYANAQEGFKTVVSHELFHAVQNAYDADMDRFWAEGSAQWAMKELYPELKDLERNLPAYFSESSRSFDTPPPGAVAGFLYGAAIWPVYLTTRTDKAIVREILEQEATLATLPATDAALQARGSSLADEFPMFVAWNACTSTRAGAGGYPDAKSYPAIKTITEADGGTAKGITSGMSSFTFHFVADGASQVAIETDAARNGAVLVPLVDGKCQLDKAAKLPASFEGEALVAVAGVTTKKTDAPFTLTLGPAPSGGPPDAGPPAGGGGSSGGCSLAEIPPAGGGDLGNALFTASIVALLTIWGRSRASRRGGRPATVARCRNSS